MAVAGARGVVGGVTIYHQERFARVRGWFLSPHFHFLGYLGGGYGCRRCERLPFACKMVCGGCSGFEALTRRLYKKDGWIVKVKGERKTVSGTAWYQINHSSYQVDAKRHNVATWFCTCCYRKLKVKVEKEKSVCPICQHGVVKLRYLGDNSEILRLMGVLRCHGEKLDVYASLYEAGRVVWVEDEIDKRRWDDAKIRLPGRLHKSNSGYCIASVPYRRLVELARYDKLRWSLIDGWLILEAF